jgi:hypothetical protein
VTIKIRVCDFVLLVAWLQYQEHLLQELERVLHELTTKFQERKNQERAA